MVGTVEGMHSVDSLVGTGIVVVRIGEPTVEKRESRYCLRQNHLLQKMHHLNRWQILILKMMMILPH
jgi:hypothetical protein